MSVLLNGFLGLIGIVLISYVLGVFHIINEGINFIVFFRQHWNIF